MPQTAERIDNDMSKVYDNEILLDVIALNVDSASFTQIEEEAGHDVDKIGKKILEIVAGRGKQQNPVTGSGGMLIGKVARIGSALKDRDLKVGDKIASLVSLSLTPLKINRIIKVMPEVDRVLIDGQAILFESRHLRQAPRRHGRRPRPRRPRRRRRSRPDRQARQAGRQRADHSARAASPDSCAATRR